MRIAKTFHFRLITTSALLLLAAIFLVALLVSTKYQESMIAQNTETTLKAFAEATQKIDRLLSDAHNTAIRVQYHKEVENYLFGTFTTDVQRVLAKRAMLDVLSDVLIDNRTINGILFFQDDGCLNGSGRSVRFSYEHAPHPFFQEQSLDQLPIGPSMTWLGGFWQSDFTIWQPTSKSADQIMIVGASRKRYSYSYSEKAATIITLVSISETALYECLDVLDDGNGDVFLLDEHGRQLAAPDALALNEIPWFFSAIESGESFGGINAAQGEETYQIVYQEMPSTKWRLVKLIPFERFNEPIAELWKTTLTISAVVLVVMTFLYTIWSLQLIKPLKETSAALEAVRKGDLSIRMEQASGVYEFDLMRTEFNRMIQSINHLLEQTRTMEHERVTLELRSLQSQLNPHMVFNSISAIRWMAMMSGADKVSDMLIELAELIRPLFSEWRLSWTLREEMYYTEHYLKLLRLRYGAMMDVQVDIPGEMLALSLPCFTLQPLLENSCTHGICPEKSIVIQVSGGVDGQGAYLSVRDNGRGMPPETLRTLLGRIAGDAERPEQPKSMAGIGLCNIHRRIQMFCGTGCGLSIESSETLGTCIVLRLGFPDTNTSFSEYN